MAAPADRWTQGDAYERYIGRWSRRVAREFVAWLGRPPGERWLDAGCGSGALAAAALEHGAGEVVGLDRSPAYAAHARATAPDSRLRFGAADVRALPLRDGSRDLAVSGLVLNFVPEPRLALSEMTRVTRRDGRVAVYVWDYAVRMEMLRRFWDAAIALDPAAAALDEGVRFPICHRRALNDLFEEVGLRQVEVQPIDVPTVFQDFDDYWMPFLSGQGPAPGYVADLAEPARERLRETLRSRLPADGDGRIALVARAWAARGVRGV